MSVRPPADGKQSDGCRKFWSFRHTSVFETVAEQRAQVQALPHTRLRMTGTLKPGEETVELVTDAGSYPLVSFKHGQAPAVLDAEHLTDAHRRARVMDRMVPLARVAYGTRGNVEQALAEHPDQWGSGRISSVEHPLLKAIERVVLDRRALIGAFDGLLKHIEHIAATTTDPDTKALAEHLVESNSAQYEPDEQPAAV